MKKILSILILFISFSSFSSFGQVDSTETDTTMTYDALDTTSIEQLMKIKIKIDVKEIFVVETFYKGLENVTLETLMKVKITESDVEQRALTLEEIENLPIEKILKLEASMNTDQGVKKVELDLSDFSLEELLQMNVDTETNIEKKQK